MNINVTFNRAEVRGGIAEETVVVECSLRPAEVEKLEQISAGLDLPLFVACAIGLGAEQADVVKVKEGISDNPEDHTMDCLRITITLQPGNLYTINQLRGGDTIQEYVRRSLPVQRGTEYQEQAEVDQSRPWIGMPAGDGFVLATVEV